MYTNNSPLKDSGRDNTIYKSNNEEKTSRENLTGHMKTFRIKLQNAH